MKTSKYYKKNKEELKQRAIKLYKTGLSTRDVAKVIGKSHVWVALRVRNIEESMAQIIDIIGLFTGTALQGLTGRLLYTYR